MERESFEDDEVAEILNRSYVAIKVDREERPDIDHLYMAYCQAMTGSGGWPLTVLLTPDKKPFLAGTYFPKRSNYGRPGLTDILNQVTALWREEKEKVLKTADELYQAVAARYVLKKGDSAGSERDGNFMLRPAEGEENVSAWGRKVIKKCYMMLEKSFDPEFGGFGRAPKFPVPHNLAFLLRYALEEPQSDALKMVEKTLDAMAAGGIWDHIGFGFARYSTDRYWLVPHFEKMLYDNAGLALLYLEAYQVFKKESYMRIARCIFQYILRDMTSPEGGFYSAEDADSEGVEGKYYVWGRQEIKDALQRELQALRNGEYPFLIPEKETAVAQFLLKEEKLSEIYCGAFGISEQGNYEGKNIPNKIFSNWEEIAFRNNMTINELEQVFAICSHLLFRVREKRIKPAKDDKILTAWNGLMIAALAKGVQLLTSGNTPEEDRQALLLAAEKAVQFIRSRMIDGKGRLLARYRQGSSDYLGYLDDYVFFICGLLQLYTACGKPEYLKLAVELQEEQERLFHDEKYGGYYFTGKDSEELLLRPKETYDGALPSGNSLSLSNLGLLWRITGEQKWLDLLEKHCLFLKPKLEEYPPRYCSAIQGLQFYLSKGDEIVLSGPLNGAASKMQAVIFEDFRPFTALAYNEGSLAEFVPRMRDYPVSTKMKAYLCRDFACREPVDSPEDLRGLLNQEHRPSP